jgi:hypothetical protein
MPSIALSMPNPISAMLPAAIPATTAMTPSAVIHTRLDQARLRVPNKPLALGSGEC